MTDKLLLLAQRLTRKYGEDVSQRVIMEILEGNLTANLIERRAVRLARDERRLNKRMINTSHPQVHRVFYGEVD